ncbi:relaxase/mobilization nuclease domain-containing protein [Enterococcus hirae]|uniref:relaxase/mobilization nuclease domain-containing protein n=1 Tax=Enterococcus hirae TaxID=1354 RepID=UPI0015F24868|nr:relaxase/mobilization nuclease domain-containing protein [Enterococcus hirae]MBA5264944.1 relaxase/mobilization nuclease domain-containing protein [Enterococcus hirae]
MGATITSKGRKKNLASLLQYAANPSKKEKCVAVSGINCSDDSEEALEEMNLVRTKMNKSKDIAQAWHVIHSFDKSISKELSIEKMHEISIEFAEKAFPNSQIIVASHNDKDHFHSHLVINNFDMDTNKRLRIDPKDLERLRKINDEVLIKNGLEPVDNEYYENLEKRTNLYSNDPSKLKSGKINYQEFVQNAIEATLKNREVNSFEHFSDHLAKEYNIEVYQFSKTNNKLGYVLYKDDVNFYERRDELISLGRDKQSRKEKSQYVERTFSARKLGKRYSFESVYERLENNLEETHQNNFVELDTEQIMALASGVDYKTGKLNVPFVELDHIAQKQFSNRDGDKQFIKYDEFLREVDKHYASTISLEDDQEYTIKLHTDVNPRSLRSTKNKKIAIKKTDQKELLLPAEGFKNCSHTPSAKQIHYQISRIINDDVKMYRAKKDYEFTQQMIENQQKRQRDFEMGF